MSEKGALSMDTTLENDENKENAIISPISPNKNAVIDESKVNSSISPSSSNGGVFLKEDATVSVSQGKRNSILQSSTKMPGERRNSSIR